MIYFNRVHHMASFLYHERAIKTFSAKNTTFVLQLCTEKYETLLLLSAINSTAINHVHRLHHRKNGYNGHNLMDISHLLKHITRINGHADTFGSELYPKHFLQ